MILLDVAPWWQARWGYTLDLRGLLGPEVPPIEMVSYTTRTLVFSYVK